MDVKWKSNKQLKPSIILDKINNIKAVGEDKNVSYSGDSVLIYHDAMAALQSMVEFPEATMGLDREYIVSKAVNNIAKDFDLDKSKVINEINSIVKEQLASREYRFHILTSISLGAPYPEKSIEIENCRIRLIASDYPNKYSEREHIVKPGGSISDNDPGGYAKVIISLKAKSEKSAVTTALRVLDIRRAIWSLLSNPLRQLWPVDDGRPINVIRLGGVHTVHKENGRLATKTYWYEPNFVKAAPFVLSEPEVIAKHSKWVMKQIGGLSYGDVLKDALLRYVRALDERNHNVVLILLWGALEVLTSPEAKANYDLVVRRTSSVFKEKEYCKQVMEHLRDCRNRTVHAGDQSDKAKMNCYQLQHFFRELVFFHLRNTGEFSDLNEANNFLDLTSNKEALERRKRLIEKAIKFVS